MSTNPCDSLTKRNNSRPRAGGSDIKPSPSSRLRSPLGLFVAAFVIPLAFVALGLWQERRAAADLGALEVRRAEVAALVAGMDTRPRPGSGIDPGLRRERDGQTYIGELARAQARDTLRGVELGLTVARYRQQLAPIVTVAGAVVVVLACLIVAMAFALGRAGRRSRAMLATGFALVRRILPALLILQIVLSAGGFVAAVAGAALAFLDIGTLSPRRMLLIGAGLLAIGASLVAALRAVLQLRRVAGAFAPEPLVVPGHAVSREQAPGLWQLATTLAGRLGAEPPDAIVVGLAGGFFVVGGPVRLDEPAQTLAGNTLYAPLPYLAFHQEDEIAVIVGHELSHFAGQDTVYAKSFAPVYAGVGRSLDALVDGGTTRHGSLALLIQPALRLALYVMNQFDHAVQGWSRRRELDADAAGAALVSPDAAARTMLRHDAARGLVDDVLAAAWRKPGDMPADLIAFMVAQAPLRGLDDPRERLDVHTPHPTDSHPPTRARFAAFGHDPSEAMIAEAMALPGPEASVRLGRYFADPGAVVRAATGRFIAEAIAAARAERADMEATAGAVGEDVVALHENTRPIAVIVFVLAAIHLGGGLALALLGFPGVDGGVTALIALGLGAAGLAYVVLALRALRRGRRPFLVLRQDELRHRHLDQPIGWSDVEVCEIYDRAGSVITSLKLREEAAFPRCTGGGRRVRLDVARRIVTFTAVPPRDLNVEGFADLLYRYHDASEARRALAQAAA